MSVRNALLGLLAQRPRHGYELRSAFEALAGGAENWDVKPAQVYTTLSRLQENGLVAEEATLKEGGPEKRVYTLTQAGEEELNTWFSTPVKSDHRRDEFFLKLVLSLATQAIDPRKVIYAQRSSLYQELHDLTAQRGEIDSRSDLAHILLFDQAIMHVEADLRWLEIIETRLDEIRRQPLPEPEVRLRGRPPKAR